MTYKNMKWALVFVTISLLATGCKPQAEPQTPASDNENPQPAHIQAAQEKQPSNGPSEKNGSNAVKLWTTADNRPWTELNIADETWDLCFIQGSRIGYLRNRVTPLTLPDGQKAVKAESFSRLKMQRFGQSTQIDFITESTESPRGELIAFNETMKNGPTPQTIQARVEGKQLQLSSQGRDLKRLPWSPEVGGFNAIEHSLLSRPMKPNERRRLRHLVPMFDTVATTELIAKAIEPVELLHGTFRLLRINTITTLPDGTQITGSLWTDSKGQQLKTHTSMLNQETYRVSQAEALAQHKPGQIDLGFDTLIKPDRPLKNPHEIGERGETRGEREQGYLVTLEGNDPATVFATGPSQTVEPIDAHTARITVRAIRPGQEKAAKKEATSAPPTMADLNPNRYIESDDPIIQAMAKEATQDATSTWEKAVAAERYVHDNLQKADYSQAFATALETAKSKRGDCSEHAVLLAALGRASGIPSRVVVGLVYSEPLGAFGFHMWTEMFIDGTWIPMDATLGHGGIGVGHLKLGHTTLQNGLADSVFFTLPKTLGKLKIKVE